MNLRTKIFLSLFGVVVMVIAMSCSDDQVSSSDLGSAAVVSPFAASSGLSAILKGSRSFPVTAADRQDQISTLLAEEKDHAQCKFTIDLAPGSTRADCYGPNVALSGTHPDSAAAVSAFGTSGGSPNPLPTGDVGFYNSTNGTNSEACASAEVTALVDSQLKSAYFAQVAGASLICYAQSKSLMTSSVPRTVSSTITLDTAQLAEYGFTDSSGSIFTPSLATIESITGGIKVTIQGTATQSSVARNFEIRLSYRDETDGGFSGRASYAVRNSSETSSACSGAGATGSSAAGHMIFSRADASSNVKLTLNHSVFCGVSYSMFDGDDEIDVCDEFTGSTISDATDADNGWESNWNYLNFDFDPSTYVGTYAYAWQAGRLDGNTRVFNAKLNSDDTGVGYFGFGTDVADSTTSCTARNTDIGKIKGMICNWAGPSNNHNSLSTSPYVQMQTLTKSSGLWKVASEKIKYIPRNDCQTLDTGWTYRATSNNSGTPLYLSYTNDYTGGSSGTYFDLESLTNYQAGFTLPTEPTF